MLKFLNLKPEIFAVDINDLALRVVKLKKKRKGFRLVSFKEVEIKTGIVKEGVIQDKEALAKIIKSATSTVVGEKLNTKYVIISLPEEKSFSQVIRMPNMTDEELVSAVPFEAENYIPLTIDKVYLDFQTINPHKNGLDHLDLLINVMPKPIVDSYVSSFKIAGLVPCILEIESHAIVRALVKNQENTLPTIFIDFGQTKTSFIIFSGNYIRFTSSITISSQQLTNTISNDLGISFKAAEELKTKYGLTKSVEKKYSIADIINPILHDLVVQIKKYISFYQGHGSHEYFSSDSKIQKIILCGGGSNLKGLPNFLAEELKISVEIGNPLINILPQKRSAPQIISQQKALSFTTVLGLALRGASEEI